MVIMVNGKAKTKRDDIMVHDMTMRPGNDLGVTSPYLHCPMAQLRLVDIAISRHMRFLRMACGILLNLPNRR